MKKFKQVMKDPKKILLFFLHRLYFLVPSEKKYLEWQYYLIMGKKLDLAHPATLNEKLQWLKLYDRKEVYHKIVDKYSMKKFVSDFLGEDITVKNLGIWDKYSEIDFSKLPDRFVLKTTHGGGGTGVVICKDKQTFDHKRAAAKLNKSLNSDSYAYTKEWPYKGIPRKIIAEEYLESRDGKIPNDYKLHYINGGLQFIYVSYDRLGVNDRCVFDSDWNRLPFVWVESYKYHKNMNTADVPCPPSFDRMKEIGKELAQLFKYVRIDFYDVDGKLYLGEITLFHGSGYDTFFPSEYDTFYGNKLKL